MTGGRAVWVTGAGGFVGRHLVAALRERGQAALALVRDPARVPSGAPAARLDLEEAARADPGGAVLDLRGLPEPAGLVHLAAWSHVLDCEAQPDRARAVNVLGPARLYEQVLARWPQLPVLHVSSAYVYRPQPLPLREDGALEPRNVYGATKLQGEAVALGWRDRGHRVSILRPFNHTGPGQGPRLALPRFALEIAALERAGGGELPVGNLDAVRDFLHVREVAAAYCDLLPRAGEVDVVNVCSGVGQRIGDLLDGLLHRARAPIPVRVDPSRLRGDADPQRLVGDPSRLAALLGRRLHLDPEALLDELLADTRSRHAAGRPPSPA